MTITSIDAMIAGVRGSVRRFPFVMLSALTCWALACYMVDQPDKVHSEKALRILMSAALGLPIFFALTVTAERHRRASPAAWSAWGLVAILGYYLSTFLSTQTIATYRFWQFALGFHLLVAVLPYVRRGEAQGFWQYNRILFQRFMLGAIYSAVIYVGLAVAVQVIRSLLGVPLPNELFAYLWLTVVFVFHPLYFLSGAPEDWAALERDQDYPTPLRVMVQYIHIPLVTLYLLILYLYMGKIAMAGTWPKGTIGWLVCGISVFGILTLLNAHPLRERAGYRWVARFTEVFYIALIPVAILLAMALYRRISPYGITENRYVLVMLNLWIAAVAIRFALKPQTSIKMIPLSLAVLVLGSSFGPWGAYDVSMRSQRRRLQNMLIEHKLLENGKFVPAKQELNSSDVRDLTQVLTYLTGSYGIKPIERWLPAELANLETEKTGKAGVWMRRYSVQDPVSEKLIKYLRIDGSADRARSANGLAFHYMWRQQGELHAIDVKGYSFAAHVGMTRWHKSPPMHLGNATYQVQLASATPALELRDAQGVLLRFDIAPLIQELAKTKGLTNYTMAPGSMVVDARGTPWDGRLVIRSMRGQGSIAELDGHLLLRENK